MFGLPGPQPGLLGAQTGITDRVAPQQRDFDRRAISAYLARNEASAQGLSHVAGYRKTLPPGRNRWTVAAPTGGREHPSGHRGGAGLVNALGSPGLGGVWR
jgi:hypothetical protein